MSKSLHPQPQLRLVYPTLKNVQESLNGYRSGTSIHWTITSPAHEAQEAYMRPLLRQWHSIKAGRERAAPHIKTYGRLTKDNTLDWFLMTSANLSKAAWGGQEGKTPNIGLRIRSYEAGVLLDPALYGDGTVLVPTFRSDLPSDEQVRWAKEKGYKTIVAVRMAWDIPFKKYDAGDVPWVKNRSYEGTDWLGMAWVA
jgi:tyrosyl-DNA phosphodiesterase 1